MQMKYIRRVTGSRRLDKIRNTALRRMVRVPSILIEVEKRKMRWFGHIIRMDEQKPARMVWRTRAQGRNGRGRPRRKWDDGMVDILRRREVGWNEAIVIARERNRWRQLVDSVLVEEE